MVSMHKFLTAEGTYGRREQVERLNGAIWRSFGDGWVEPMSDDRPESLWLYYREEFTIFLLTNLSLLDERFVLCVDNTSEETDDMGL